MEEKPLENRCGIQFVCRNHKGKPCVYKVDGEPRKIKGYRQMIVSCKFLQFGHICTSSVANVNAMVLEMKRMGVEFDGIKSMKSMEKNK